MESLPAQMIQTEVIPKDSHLSPGVINFALLFATQLRTMETSAEVSNIPCQLVTDATTAMSC